MPVIDARLARLSVAVCVLAAAAAPALAQKKDDKKLKESERLEAQALVRAVDHVMASQAAPGTSAWTVDPSKREGGVTPVADAPAITWRYDTLKAQEGKIYVPFAVEFPASAIEGSSTAMYLRLTARGATAPPEPSEKGKDDEKPDVYPFEDLHFTQSLASAAGEGMAKIMRAFAVAAGPYDVYVAMMPHATEAKKNAPARVVLLKQQVDVPDFWNAELNTSSIIVADKVEGLSAPLSPEQQRERPYVLGQTEIVPAVDTTFKKSEELTIIFQIYNPTLDNKKPDVTVEYNFFRKEGEAEKPFNRMAPQHFNPQTLPPQFDPEAGFQLAAGWSVPLQSFPEGDFRLEIKVVDNRASKTLTREVRFSVAGS